MFSPKRIDNADFFLFLLTGQEYVFYIFSFISQKQNLSYKYKMKGLSESIPEALHNDTPEQYTNGYI
jgi:hypothetical protein